MEKITPLQERFPRVKISIQQRNWVDHLWVINKKKTFHTLYVQQLHLLGAILALCQRKFIWWRQREMYLKTER